MKANILSLFFVLIIASLFFAGCKKDDSNPINDSNFSGKGSDYLPISSGKILNAKVSGSTTEYDSLGRVIAFSQISNETYNGTIGVSTFIRNMNANPIFGNDEGNSELIGYLSNNNGEIIGFDNNTNSQAAVILPAELTVGKEWVVNPQSPLNEQFKVKLVEFLNSFTNSAGKTFQNTINILVTYKDSTGGIENYGWYFGSWYEKKSIKGNIYLAKGIGIVGAKVNDYEYVGKSNYHNTFGDYNYYKKTKANGEVGIID